MAVSPTLATESPGTLELLPPPQAATTSAMTTKKAPSAENRNLFLTRIARLATRRGRIPDLQDLFRARRTRSPTATSTSIAATPSFGRVREVDAEPRRRLIVEGLRGFAESVESLLPRGFAG